MFPVKAGLPGLPNLNFPDVCIEQLNPGLAFCKQHCDVAEAKGYPTRIKDFLKFCGVLHSSGIELVAIYRYISL